MDENYVGAINWIHSREQFGSRPGLYRIEYLLEKLGNPQNNLKIVHIAGTNGKGSTVSYLKELFLNSGLCVGTFTSPFIERFNERICIDGHHIPDEDIVFLVNKLQPIVIEMDNREDVYGLTEFELVTAMMFYYFHEKKVDVAVIEVGLGGLLDSTNVVSPIICGITTIGFDHMQILGDTIEKIAEQKAGIIKQNCSVVTGNIPEKALRVIEQKASSLGVEIYRYNLEYHVNHILSEHLSNEYFSFNNATHNFSILNTTLLGKHQVENAGAALQIYLIFMEKCKMSVNRKMISESLNDAFIPGRMEILSESPFVIVDGAHNVPAIETLKSNLQEILTKTEAVQSRLFILFSAINTKDVSGMIRLLEDIQHAELMITSFENDFAFNVTEIEKNCHKKTNVMSKWEEAITILLNQMSKDDFLVITGSLYFVSTVRKKLKERQEKDIVIIK